MVKNLVIMFNGFFSVVFGTGIATGQLIKFTNYNRWVCGFALIIIGIWGVYYSNVVQEAFKKSDKNKIVSTK
jgi:putative Mn2+ efflux pump MntP